MSDATLRASRPQDKPITSGWTVPLVGQCDFGVAALLGIEVAPASIGGPTDE
jgi:hypothetical protein